VTAILEGLAAMLIGGFILYVDLGRWISTKFDQALPASMRGPHPSPMSQIYTMLCRAVAVVLCGVGFFRLAFAIGRWIVASIDGVS
jgi:hypothetical protein